MPQLLLVASQSPSAAVLSFTCLPTLLYSLVAVFLKRTSSKEKQALIGSRLGIQSQHMPNSKCGRGLYESIKTQTTKTLCRHQANRSYETLPKPRFLERWGELSEPGRVFSPLCPCTRHRPGSWELLVNGAGCRGDGSLAEQSHGGGAGLAGS